jgi:hypothetical protein
MVPAAPPPVAIPDQEAVQMPAGEPMHSCVEQNSVSVAWLNEPGPSIDSVLCVDVCCVAVGGPVDSRASVGARVKLRGPGERQAAAHEHDNDCSDCRRGRRPSMPSYPFHSFCPFIRLLSVGSWTVVWFV